MKLYQDNKLIQNSDMNYSYHSKFRMSQRGISTDAINACIHYGEAIHKQSLVFIYIPKKKLENLSPNLQSKVKDLVVVTNLHTDCVITCYRNSNALHRIKKKPKRLSKY